MFIKKLASEMNVMAYYTDNLNKVAPDIATTSFRNGLTPIITTQSKGGAAIIGPAGGQEEGPAAPDVNNLWLLVGAGALISLLLLAR